MEGHVRIIGLVSSVDKNYIQYREYRIIGIVGMEGGFFACVASLRNSCVLHCNIIVLAK